MLKFFLYLFPLIFFLMHNVIGMKVIDDKGAFESDDEVGAIFEQIKETVNQLDDLIGEEINANK